MKPTFSFSVSDLLTFFSKLREYQKIRWRFKKKLEKNEILRKYRVQKSSNGLFKIVKIAIRAQFSTSKIVQISIFAIFKTAKITILVKLWKCKISILMDFVIQKLPKFQFLQFSNPQICISYLFEQFQEAKFIFQSLESLAFISWMLGRGW